MEKYLMTPQKIRKLPAPLALAGIMFFIASSSAAAFYESSQEEDYLSLRASIRTLGVVTQNPDFPLLYKEKNDTLAGGMGRLELAGSWGGWISMEINAYALALYNSGSDRGSSFVKLQSAERSGALEKGLFESSDSIGEAALDWANLTFTLGKTDLTIGRQPVNLASTMYFTPNDFFAPFAADVFYRVYKAGVDAARLEVGLGSLTQLTLLTVAGYGVDAGTASGFDADMDEERTSYVARISTVAFDYEFVALAGKVRRRLVAGGSFQGTLFNWLGLRMEGHWAELLDGMKKGRFEGTLELERRFPSSLDLRLAVFHHGGGAGKTEQYADYLLAEGAETTYIARWYAGAGASYEFTPLWSATALALMNLVDRSYAISVNGVYSLSNEGELFIGLSVPTGDKPEGLILKSEYGASPISASAEIRYYF